MATQIDELATTQEIGYSDLKLARDGADAIAQRRGTNAQTLRVYGTYTDASNYERLSISYDGVRYVIGPQMAGTGATRTVRINAPAGAYVELAANGNARLQVRDTDGNVYMAPASAVLFASDGAHDIGASGANRPRNGYFSGQVYASSTARTGQFTVAALPSAATAGVGARAFVTDANATTFNSTVAGGGANNVPVFSDGTNWVIG